MYAFTIADEPCRATASFLAVHCTARSMAVLVTRLQLARRLGFGNSHTAVAVTRPRVLLWSTATRTVRIVTVGTVRAVAVVGGVRVPTVTSTSLALQPSAWVRLV